MGIQLEKRHNPLLILALCSLAILSACSSGTKRYPENEPTAASNTEAESTASAQPVVISQSDEAASAESSAEAANEINQAAIASIRNDTPKRYIVKRGDTLWGIAGHFLNDPWYWPELWVKNPQIQNPHLIFPGDIISLIYVNGQPVIELSRNGRVVTRSDGVGTTADATTQPMATDQQVETNTFERVYKGGPLKQVRLSPTIRSSSLKDSIKTIPSDAIQQFTSRPQIVTEQQWNDAPYIVGSDDQHLILGQGNRIYIRGELDKEKLRYSIFRRGNILKDPKTGEILGNEVIYAGEASINRYDDPASGRIVKATREIIVGDRLLPVDTTDLNNLFFPKPPEKILKGQVVSLFDALYGIAQYQVAVINLGSRDGLEVGNILSTYTKGEIVRDRFEKEEGRINIQLPNERSGIMMIFKVFDRVSYGLVLEATRIIEKHDEVRTPFK